MYALIIPALLPFILLGTVMGLSWWEDRLLPPAAADKVLLETQQSPAISATPLETGLVDTV